MACDVVCHSLAGTANFLAHTFQLRHKASDTRAPVCFEHPAVAWPERFLACGRATHHHPAFGQLPSSRDRPRIAVATIISYGKGPLSWMARLTHVRPYRSITSALPARRSLEKSDYYPLCLHHLLAVAARIRQKEPHTLLSPYALAYGSDVGISLGIRRERMGSLLPCISAGKNLGRFRGPILKLLPPWNTPRMSA